MDKDQTTSSAAVTIALHLYPDVVLWLGLFGISRVDAVSAVGTLNKDKAAVPDDWRAAVAPWSAGRGGEGAFRHTRRGRGAVFTEDGAKRAR